MVFNCKIFTYSSKGKKKKIKKKWNEIKFESYFKNYLATNPHNSEFQILIIIFALFSIKNVPRQTIIKDP